MLPVPCLVFGDTHIGAAPADVERRVLAFLRAARRRAASVVVNGDLFDFWFEWRHVLPRRGFRIVAALGDLVDAGIPVRWQAGNHDCWGGDLLVRDLGIDYSAAPFDGRIGEWHAWIHHGDGLREEADRGYRKWQRVLRHPAAIRAYRWLHPDVGTALALGTSKTSRAHNAHDEGAGLRDVAFARMAGVSGPDLVIFGHSHAAALLRAPSGGVYANAGSWLDAPTFLRIDASRVTLLSWADASSAEPDELDALDRLAEESAREGGERVGGISHGES